MKSVLPVLSSAFAYHRTFDTCADPAAKQVCNASCLDGYTECLKECEEGDVVCKSLCAREVTVCQDACPCGENCPAGCTGCETWECSCETVGHNHLDALDCRTDAEYRYNYCKVFSCQNAGDKLACEEECFFIYNSDIQKCPCAPGCPNGCPCAGYQCVQGSTTTQPPSTSDNPAETTSPVSATTTPPIVHPHTNFVALNSFVEHKAVAWEWPPKMDDPTVDLLDMFEFEEPISVLNSCSLVLNGVMYVLGGSAVNTQLAVVDGCGLKMAGTLPEAVDGGLCTTFREKTQEHGIICSPTTKSKSCLRFTPEDGLRIGSKDYPDMTEQHHGGAIVLYEDMPMVLAGGQTLVTETLQAKGGKNGPSIGPSGYYWKGSASLSGTHHNEGLSAVNYFGTVYAFGGKGLKGAFDSCQYYTSYHWEMCKQPLSASRFGHRSVVDGDSIIHFGGSYDESELNVPMERWTSTGLGRFTITVSNTTFDNFFQYPELFHLDEQLLC